ncbi:hypothetical protein CEXT_352391 [Caerostris extrusa]|uniref:Uncharacterized protein n=1 Tax=Caerostris extrusa TaxID=172846 RepID=A0AAV4UDN9_CAEEX|nr:hypothetical protein CEXT_352391 [Caerostris extrusa]
MLELIGPMPFRNGPKEFTTVDLSGSILLAKSAFAALNVTELFIIVPLFTEGLSRKASRIQAGKRLDAFLVKAENEKCTSSRSFLLRPVWRKASHRRVHAMKAL